MASFGSTTFDLCLWQRIDSFCLDRVERCEDHERCGQVECRAFDCHLPFLHRLEKGGLRFRRGSVDLISQDQIGEQRALPHLKFGVPLVEEVVSGDI
jgi:hypothetical protein